MAFISLQDEEKSKSVIMIFVEGTILKPKSKFFLYNHKSYIPIGNAVSLIDNWHKQGAEIVYCTSRKGKQAEDMAILLSKFGFCGTRIYYRDKKQKYKDIIETVKPNYLIEDDCKSIGGKWQMCITYVAQNIRDSICSIVVKEFGGIDEVTINL